MWPAYTLYFIPAIRTLPFPAATGSRTMTEEESGAMATDKQIRIFASHAEAEAANRAYIQSLTPEQRMDILLELVHEGTDEASEGFKRVCRTFKRGER